MSLSLIETPEEEETSRLQKVLGFVRTGVGIAAIATLLFALSGLGAWLLFPQSAEAEAALTRDAALAAATTHIETLNTLDYRKIDEGLENWAAATTGLLHDQVSSVPSEDRESLAAAEKVTKAEVVDAAIIDLDLERGVATVIASVEVSVTDADGETTVKRNRFSSDAVLVDDEWLLETLQQVAVDL